MEDGRVDWKTLSVVLVDENGLVGMWLWDIGWDWRWSGRAIQGVGGVGEWGGGDSPQWGRPQFCLLLQTSCQSSLFATLFAYAFSHCDSVKRLGMSLSFRRQNRRLSTEFALDSMLALALPMFKRRISLPTTYIYRHRLPLLFKWDPLDNFIPIGGSMDCAYFWRCCGGRVGYYL